MLLLVLGELEKEYGSLVYSDSRDNVIKYLVGRGFIEISLDSPFVITGHFSRNKDASEFNNALGKVLGKFNARKVNIIKNVERASIFAVWRAWRRERKSRKEIRRLFR